MRGGAEKDAPFITALKIPPATPTPVNSSPAHICTAPGYHLPHRSSTHPPPWPTFPPSSAHFFHLPLLPPPTPHQSLLLLMQSSLTTAESQGLPSPALGEGPASISPWKCPIKVFCETKGYLLQRGILPLPEGQKQLQSAVV